MPNTTTRTFARAARSRYDLDPAEPNVGLADWERLSVEVPPVSEPEYKLLRAGCWMTERFHAVRWHNVTALGEWQPDALGLITWANAYQSAVDLKVDDLGVDPRTAMNLRLEGPFDPSGATPDGHLEAVVECLRRPLALALRASALPGPPTASGSDTLRQASQGWMIEAVLDDLWQKCLWLDWEVVRSGEEDRVAPAVEDVERRRAAALFEFLQRGVWGINPALAAQVRAGLGDKVISVEVSPSGKARVQVARTRSDDLHRFTARARRIQTERLMLPGLVGAALPEVGGHTLADVFDLWEALFQMAARLVGRFTAKLEGDGTVGHDDILAITPALDVANLTAGLGTYLRWSPTKTSRVLGFLTHDGWARRELYDRPVVPVGPQRCCLAAVGLLSVNLRRTADRWLKGGGYAIDERGHIYEAWLIAQLDKLIKATGVLERSGVFPHSRMFVFGRGRDDKEEIDLLVWINQTLLMFEVRFSFFPTDPKEHFRYRQRLEEKKARQAARKGDFIHRHMSAFTAELRAAGFAGTPGDYRVLPFILVNQPFCVGEQIEGIPVTDGPTLLSFFNGGRPYLPWTSEVHPPLFQSESEAEQMVEDYLSRPGWLGGLEARTVSRHRPLPTSIVYGPGSGQRAGFAEFNTQAALQASRVS